MNVSKEFFLIEGGINIKLDHNSCLVTQFSSALSCNKNARRVGKQIATLGKTRFTSGRRQFDFLDLLYALELDEEYNGINLIGVEAIDRLKVDV